MSKWISIDDRLPPFGLEVVLYRPDAAKTCDPVLTIRKRRRNSHGPFEFEETVAVPTHWMPLPQPPSAS